MLKEAMQWIADQSNRKIIDVNGLPYTFTELYLAKPPVQEYLKFSTLETFVNYVDEFAPEDSFVFVESSTEVALLKNKNNNFGQRQVLAKANHRWNGGFGIEMSYEDFILFLYSSFVQTDAMKELLDTVMSISFESSEEIVDTGVGQQTVVKEGAALKKKKIITPFHYLNPFRTFSDIEQPEMMFLFRIIGKNYFILKPVENNDFELEAMTNIREFIVNAVEKDIKII